MYLEQRNRMKREASNNLDQEQTNARYIDGNKARELLKGNESLIRRSLNSPIHCHCVLH